MSTETLAERFATAVEAAAATLPGPELLPEHLARAVTAVLPVDGAGISMVFAPDRRLPLGASDEVAAEAERLQFTVGEGPCLHAQATGETVVAEEAEIRARWPAFHDALVTRTPVRGVVSLPLQDQLRGLGAVDLFLAPPHHVRAIALVDALAVTREVSRAFTDAGRPVGAEGPAWLGAPAAQRRALVWQAMGFLNAELRLTSSDALTVLRAHAYSEELGLDELAARVLTGEVPIQQLAFDEDRSG